MTIRNMFGGSESDWVSVFDLSPHHPAKVIAGEDLPRGSFVSIPVAEVQKIHLGQDKFQKTSTSKGIEMEIFLRRNQLYVPGVSPPLWLSALPLAEDVHSETARLSTSPDQGSSNRVTVEMTLTKRILKGESVAFWFSSDLAAELGIPFLNFSHIKDGCYMCPACPKRFLTPNPLKLHLATSCDLLGSGFLWSRLWSAISAVFTPWETPRLMPRKKEPIKDVKPPDRKQHMTQTSKDVFISSVPHPKTYFLSDTKLVSPDSTSPDQTESLEEDKKTLSLDSKLVSCSKGLSQRAEPSIISHSFSAFKPVCSSSNHREPPNRQNGSQDSPRQLSSLYSSTMTFPLLTSLPKNPLLTSSHLWKWSSADFSLSSSHITPPFHPPLLPLVPSTSFQNPLPSTSTVDHSTDVDTFMTSFGRGKGSHLCLYCGKVYSRKYGLKIHIRTHTGYKPLKCRVCYRPFGDPSNLNKHIRLHAQGETPYRCDLCGKVLVRKRDLDRHLRSRHPKSIIANLKETDINIKNDLEDRTEMSNHNSVISKNGSSIPEDKLESPRTGESVQQEPKKFSLLLESCNNISNRIKKDPDIDIGKNLIASLDEGEDCKGNENEDKP